MKNMLEKLTILILRLKKGGRILVFLFCVFFTKVAHGHENIDSLIENYYKAAFGLRSTDLDSAFIINNKALKLLHQTEDLKVKSDVYSVQGTLYKNNSDYEKALRYYHKGLKLRKELGDSLLIGNSLIGIGNLYYVIDQYDLAFIFLKRAVFISEELGNKRQLTLAYSNLANIYTDLIDSNRQYIDSAYFAYRRSYENADFSVYSQSNSNILLNVGILLRELGNIDSAQTLLLESQEYQKGINDYRGLARSTLNLGLIAQEKKEYGAARELFVSALEITDSTNNVETKLETLQFITELILENHDTIGLKYLTDFIALKDSLHDIKVSGNMADYYALYELDEKEKQNIIFQTELEYLKQQKELDLKENQLLWAFLIGTGILILAIIALFLFYRQKLITSKLKDQNNINKLIQEQDKKYFTAILEGQENERKRISQELHDRMGGLLTAIKIHVENLDKETKEDSPSLTKTEDLLNIAIDEIRKISNNLVSSVLTNFGLVAALYNLADTVNGTNSIHVRVISLGIDERLPIRIEINCFRIIQEMVTNTMKHANASELNIRLTLKENYLNIVFFDNGKGIDSQLVNFENGLGLKHIKHRVETLGGSISMENAAGKGLRYEISININYSND